MDINEAFKIIKEKISSWATELIALLPNILLATLVFVLGLFLARR